MNAEQELRSAVEKALSTDAVRGRCKYGDGLLCGVEDRNLQNDGYAGMLFGYERALERVDEAIPDIVAALSPIVSRLQRELSVAIIVRDDQASMVKKCWDALGSHDDCGMAPWEAIALLRQRAEAAEKATLAFIDATENDCAHFLRMVSDDLRTLKAIAAAKRCAKIATAFDALHAARSDAKGAHGS